MCGVQLNHYLVRVTREFVEGVDAYDVDRSDDGDFKNVRRVTVVVEVSGSSRAYDLYVVRQDEPQEVLVSTICDTAFPRRVFCVEIAGDNHRARVFEQLHQIIHIEVCLRCLVFVILTEIEFASRELSS